MAQQFHGVVLYVEYLLPYIIVGRHIGVAAEGLYYVFDLAFGLSFGSLCVGYVP